MKNKEKYQFNVPTISDAIMTLFGTALCGIGVGIANYARLGMDAIGVLYDGIRCALKLSSSQLGTAVYIVNAVLILFLWFVARRYVSIGTLLNFVGYGACTNWTLGIMERIVRSDAMWLRVIFVTGGLLTLYIGIAVYIAVDTGMDAFSGLTLYISEKIKKEYKVVKIGSDVISFTIGALLGGKFGIVTVVAALAGGPIIQFMTGKIQSWYFKSKIKRMSAKN